MAALKTPEENHIKELVNSDSPPRNWTFPCAARPQINASKETEAPPFISIIALTVNSAYLTAASFASFRYASLSACIRSASRIRLLSSSVLEDLSLLSVIRNLLQLHKPPQIN